MKFLSPKEQEAWDFACKLEDIHVSDLVDQGYSRKSAHAFLKRWHAGGLIDVAWTEGNQKWFRKVENNAPEKPRNEETTAEDAMWAIMRRKRYVTILDLVATAAMMGLEVSERKALAYCEMLLKCGYLRRLEGSASGKKQNKYRLINDTGRRAPVRRRLQGIWDRNDLAFTPLGICK